MFRLVLGFCFARRYRQLAEDWEHSVLMIYVPKPSSGGLFEDESVTEWDRASVERLKREVVTLREKVLLCSLSSRLLSASMFTPASFCFCSLFLLSLAVARGRLRARM